MKVVLTVVVVLAAWTFVYFAGLRSWHRRWGATAAELTAAPPGEFLFPRSAGEVTHAVTIQATPQQVWPWIMQIGQDRSGFYSYTPLENLIGCQMPKVERIVQEWPARAQGETVWFATPKHYKGQAKMIAAIVEPARAFAMVSPTDWQRIQAGGQAREMIWEFALEPAGPQQTRLIARFRAGPPATATQRLAGWFFWEPAHFVMERKMLLTIKKLAESTAVVTAAQS